MTDQEFQERVVTWIEHTEAWKTQTDNRLDNLEGQMNNLEERMGSLQEGIAWIRGKMEGTQESRAALWGKIAVLAAVGSAIMALLAVLQIRRLDVGF